MFHEGLNLSRCRIDRNVRILVPHEGLDRETTALIIWKSGLLRQQFRLKNTVSVGIPKRCRRADAYSLSGFQRNTCDELLLVFHILSA